MHMAYEKQARSEQQLNAVATAMQAWEGIGQQDGTKTDFVEGTKRGGEEVSEVKGALEA